jgi:hypothetical protein
MSESAAATVPSWDVVVLPIRVYATSEVDVRAEILELLARKPELIRVSAAHDDIGVDA